MNRRRGELLDRKYDDSLTPTEVVELAFLQEAMYRHVDRVVPLPIDTARQLHQELLEKAARSEEAK